MGNPFDLSDREILILMMLADGMKLVEMDEELHCCNRTVRNLCVSIRKKMSAKTNSHAIAIAYHKGILIPFYER